MIDEGKPIFVQIAEEIENGIIAGVIGEESQVPSTNEFAAFHRVTPTTAGKGMRRLIEGHVLYKKRGVGMFVSPGARKRLVSKRTDEFCMRYVYPLLTEAAKLGIGPEQVATMIREDAGHSAGEAEAHVGTRNDVIQGEADEF